MSEAADLGSNLSAVVLFWVWWVLLTVLDTLSTRYQTGDGQSRIGADKETPAMPIGSPCSEKIRRIDPSFNEQHFLAGAAYAYEIILQAYAAGNLAALRSLLSPDVMAAFEDAIRRRIDRGETLELTFIGMEETSIEEAAETGPGMEVVVRFIAEIVSVTRSRDGRVVEGHPERVFDTHDLWTFEPDPTSRGHSWRVTATASA